MSTIRMAPLRWDIHARPLSDSPDQRAVYLRVALTHVMDAIGQGNYELNDVDWAFVARVRTEYPAYKEIFRTI